MMEECKSCRGTGREPMSDNVNWLPCWTCHGIGLIEKRVIKCDGEHGGSRCADPECWNDTPPVCKCCGRGSPVDTAGLCFACGS